MTLPRHSGRAAQSYGEAVHTNHALLQAAGHDLDRLGVRLGRSITQDNYDSSVKNMLGENQAKMQAMQSKRSMSYRSQGASPHLGASRREHYRMSAVDHQSNFGGNPGVGTSTGGDAYNAIPRFYDPLEYWDISGLPWNVADEGHRHKLHKWLRLYYATHYLVPILIDIFTRFPLVGMELECKDPKLKEVYESIFLDNLKYEDFLVGLGREYWVVGEAFPLASFDEDLGVWEHEELINPEDIVINNFPFLNSKQLKIAPPDYLKRIAQTKLPAREYYLLRENFEDLIPYLLKGEHIPISPVMMRHVANKMNNWDDHGTPILLRGMRTLLHEEKLMASQEAIAERLYSPLILAKLGIMDMGDGLPPWLPGPEELESVRDDLDIALSSDFRVMVHHFGLEISNVFGREQMPRLGDDFDRIERRLMQVFGVNPSLLSAGSNTQPYASSALQAEFMNQILRTFQGMLKEHYRERALVVAEAQGHYDYETKGDTRIPIWEKVAITDEETGERHIEEVQKLLVPDLKFATFDMRDQATERQFLMALRQMGVPIPNEDLLIGIDWNYREKVLQYNRELKEQTIAQQRAKLDTYIALATQGLPIPLDLKAEVESVLVHGAGAGGGMPEGGGGGMAGAQQQKPGGMPGSVGPAGGPPELGPPGGGGGGINMPPPPPGLGSGPGTAPPGGGAPAASPMAPGPAGTVPQVSNERRPGLKYNTSNQGHPIIGAREGSDFDQFMADYPDLGLPFVDYVADNTEDELDKIDRGTLLSLSKAWPKNAAAYQHKVAEEVAVYLANTPDSEPEPAKVEPPVEFTLKANQELRKVKGEPDRIIETPSKKRIKHKVATDKKYTVVDPVEKPLRVTPEEEAKLRKAYFKANKIPLPKDENESTEPKSS